ncbi:MAG: AraC family transcriptional regulator [Bacteroidales bacterium]|nr:AraC family transcriptional regulator [Bacteroidales bacterium]
MAIIEPYWNPKTDMSGFLFSIKKVHREAYFDVSDIPETVLPFFSFAYLTDGEMLIEIEGKPYLCQTGQVLIIPRNVPFRVLHFNRNTGFECGFSLRVLKDVSYECLHSPQPVLQSFTPEDASFTAALLEVIYKSYQQKDYFVTASALDLFLCRIKPRKDHPDNAIVSRFLELVFDRNEKPGKVSTYASSLCITPNYLNRLVRAHTGHSAMDWIEISRLNLAKSLLKQNQLQVSEIASAVGIDDQSYFTRFFKKSEGITPTQYRDQILGSLRHSK